jgi:hypothetical protein
MPQIKLFYKKVSLSLVSLFVFSAGRKIFFVCYMKPQYPVVSMTRHLESLFRVFCAQTCESFVFRFVHKNAVLFTQAVRNISGNVKASACNRRLLLQNDKIATLQALLISSSRVVKFDTDLGSSSRVNLMVKCVCIIQTSGRIIREIFGIYLLMTIKK